MDSSDQWEINLIVMSQHKAFMAYGPQTASAMTLQYLSVYHDYLFYALIY